MNLNTTESTVVSETVSTAAPEAVVVTKTPSKKSQAEAIFAAKMVDRKNGLFPSNKEFRAAVLTAIQSQLSVSVASAATMYNSAKKDAEAADNTIVLGRDPKKEKIKVATGKRGRPAGSKNKEKDEVTSTAVVTQPEVPAQSESQSVEEAVAVVVTAEPEAAVVAEPQQDPTFVMPEVTPAEAEAEVQAEAQTEVTA